MGTAGSARAAPWFAALVAAAKFASTSAAEEEACKTEPVRAEERSWYLYYVLSFVGVYLILCGVCVYVILEERRKKRSAVWRNNRIQVTVSLVFGAIFRAASVPDYGKEDLDEVFRVFKDIFWITAFLLIILYWAELQNYAFQQNKRSVDRLRPRLYGLIVGFSIVRVAQGIFKAIDIKSALYVCYALTISFLAFVFIYGGVHGIGLLKKIKTLADRTAKQGAMKSKLRRLTKFVVLEVGFATLWMLAWLVRNVLFGSAKCNDDFDPEEPRNFCECSEMLWFLLKLVEKTLEICLMGVLCMLIVAPKNERSKAGSSSQAGAAAKTSPPSRASPVSAARSTSSKTNPLFGSSNGTELTGANNPELYSSYCSKAVGRVRKSPGATTVGVAKDEETGSMGSDSSEKQQLVAASHSKR